MSDKIVDIARARRAGPPPVSDFWFAQLDARLTRIEGQIGQVERVLWLVVYAAAVITGIEVVRALLAAQL